MVSKVPKAVKDPLHADNRNAPTPPRVAVGAPGRAPAPHPQRLFRQEKSKFSRAVERSETPGQHPPAFTVSRRESSRSKH